MGSKSLASVCYHRNIYRPVNVCQHGGRLQQKVGGTGDLDQIIQGGGNMAMVGVGWGFSSMSTKVKVALGGM